MTAKETFEAWAIANGKCSLVLYGSQKADTDYMFFSDEKFDSSVSFPGSMATFSGRRACLIISGTEFFDVALARPGIKDAQLVERRDMLRNSPTTPVWICDPHGVAEKLKFSPKSKRNRMTDEQIVSLLEGFYINVRFVQRKVFSGPLYARFLLLHSAEPTLFQLARQYDLRREGKGKWKGRDAEKIFSPEQVKMMSLRSPLDCFELAKELYGSVHMVKFWCNELKIKVPDFLENITW
jgi:hypothetical protein